MAAFATSPLKTNCPEIEVEVIVKNNDVLGRNVEEASQGRGRSAREVHI